MKYDIEILEDSDGCKRYLAQNDRGQFILDGALQQYAKSTDYGLDYYLRFSNVKIAFHKVTNLFS